MLKRIITTAAAIFLWFSHMYAVTPTLVANADERICNHWVDSVYNSLTERQRVAQLIFPKVSPRYGEKSKATLKRLVATNKVGGLLFDEGSLSQYAEMTDYAQSIAKTPLLMTFDGEWGLSMRIEGTPRFPHNMGLGAIQDPQLLYDYGREMARECRLAGIHVNFAPALDVNSNPANPVIGYRSFGEDPKRVGELGLAYSRGLEDGGVQAVGKHFPGHGDTSTDSHKERTTVTHSEKTLDDVDLRPFSDFIKGGCSGIMVGHLVVPALDISGQPASLSKKITSGVLRDKMGFEGLIYTDALEMKGAKIEGKNNAVLALQAGADVLLSSVQPLTDIDTIMAAIETGEIPKSDIEERCKRILKYKYLLGLNKKQNINTTGLSESINSPSADRINRALACASVTVIRNNDDLLPIGRLDSRTIAIINIGADKNNEFSSTCTRYAKCSLFSTTGREFSAETLNSIKKHDVVIAAVYDDKSITRSAFAQLKSIPGIVAVFMVNPYKMNKFRASFENTGSLIIAYDNTPYTREAAAMALFGGIYVDGKLPVNLPHVAPLGTGLTLRKTRLGKSSLLAEGLRPTLTDSIDSLVNVGLRTGAFPGCQVLIARNGNIVLDKCYGRLSSGGAAVTPATVYDLASVSKAVGTLPGIMKAYDMGLLDLDTLASQYLPGLRGNGKDSITVRELLYHESGMPSSLNMFNTMIDTASYTGKLITNRPDANHKIKIQKRAYGHNTASLRNDITSASASADFPTRAADGLFVGRITYDSIMQRIYDIPLRANKRYNYSCLNFALLMDIEQRLTKCRHDKFVSANIWEPIGAYTTCYQPREHLLLSDIAPTEKDNFLRRQTVHGYVHDEMAAFLGGISGNAGVFSNADDIAKICQMWLNGGIYGDARVLSAETVGLFTSSKSPTCRRGLGFDRPDTADLECSPTCDEANAEVYGHLGFTGTVFWVDPKEKIIFIFLTNRVNPTRDNPAFNTLNIRPKLFAQVYKALK